MYSTGSGLMVINLVNSIVYCLQTPLSISWIHSLKLEMWTFERKGKYIV